MVPAQRAQIMWRVADGILQHGQELAELEGRNNGMHPSYAINLIRAGAEMFRYFAGWCTKIHGLSTDMLQPGADGVSVEYHAYTLLEPIGVAGLIIPWNGPFYCAANKLAPALAAGCSCVLKPAEETPLTTLRLERILAEAGVPDGVVSVVTGYGDTTGAAMAAHPGIDKIAFTGSTQTGRHIIQAAAGNMKRVTLELGGKSPVLIFADAELPKAIQFAAAGVFTNAGQVCTAGSRVYAQRSVYDQVVEGLRKAAAAVRVGGSQDANATMGPLISSSQRDRVRELVEEGCRDGATIVAGGKPMERPGYFFEPTIMVDVNPRMRLIQEEIFGPVGTVIAFDDEDQVLREANDTEYGLAATVWSRDGARAHRLGRRLQAGIVWLNCRAVDLSMPLGGYKQSGWGHENSWKGVEAYLNTKSVYAGL
jgi:aldehyde dehydrogenase (NAD+)